jgi:enamine deaminase RidA (YjgF/YER057c/UK114 family)
VVVAGGLAHVSGQLPLVAGRLIIGRLGEDVSLEQGTAAAQACALMILAQLKAALGSLSRVERVVKLGAFVASTADFTDQPKVANGASELMAAVFGEAANTPAARSACPSCRSAQRSRSTRLLLSANDRQLRLPGARRIDGSATYFRASRAS